MGWSLISCNNIFKILASKILEDSDTRRQVKYYPKWWVFEGFFLIFAPEKPGRNGRKWSNLTTAGASFFTSNLGEISRASNWPTSSLTNRAKPFIESFQKCLASKRPNQHREWWSDPCLGKNQGAACLFQWFFFKKRFGGGSLRKFHDLCFEKKEDIYEVSPY